MARQFKPGQLKPGVLYDISSSYAITASYAENAGSTDPFPFVGAAVITGSLEIVGTGEDVLLIKNQTYETLFQVSQSGVAIFSTQSIELTNPAPNGGLYFTSSSFFVGLD